MPIGKNINNSTIKEIRNRYYIYNHYVLNLFHSKNTEYLQIITNLSQKIKNYELKEFNTTYRAIAFLQNKESIKMKGMKQESHQSPDFHYISNLILSYFLSYKIYFKFLFVFLLLFLDKMKSHFIRLPYIYKLLLYLCIASFLLHQLILKFTKISFSSHLKNSHLALTKYSSHIPHPIQPIHPHTLYISFPCGYTGILKTNLYNTSTNIFLQLPYKHIPLKDNTPLYLYFKNKQHIQCNYRLKGGSPFSFLVQDLSDLSGDRLIQHFTSDFQNLLKNQFQHASVTISGLRNAISINYTIPSHSERIKKFITDHSEWYFPNLLITKQNNCADVLPSDYHQQWTGWTKSEEQTNALHQFLTHFQYTTRPISLRQNIKNNDFQSFFHFNKQKDPKLMNREWKLKNDNNTPLVPSNYNERLLSTQNEAILSLKQLTKHAITKLIPPSPALTYHSKIHLNEIIGGNIKPTTKNQRDKMITQLPFLQPFDHLKFFLYRLKLLLKFF